MVEKTPVIMDFRSGERMRVKLGALTGLAALSLAVAVVAWFTYGRDETVVPEAPKFIQAIISVGWVPLWLVGSLLMLGWVVLLRAFTLHVVWLVTVDQAGLRIVRRALGSREWVFPWNEVRAIEVEPPAKPETGEREHWIVRGGAGPVRFPGTAFNDRDGIAEAILAQSNGRMMVQRVGDSPF